MNNLDKSDKPSYSYPKEEYPKLSFKRHYTIKNSLYSDNPSINRININSHFIFSSDDYLSYFNSLKNKNLIKLNKDEILILKNISKSIYSQKIEGFINTDFIDIQEEMYSKLLDFSSAKTKKSDIGEYISQKILQTNNRSEISCRKLADDYYHTTGVKIGKSTINNIMRNELGLRYLKTTLKTNYLKSEPSLISSLGFIKAFVKCIKLGFDPIYIDESKIENINNHFRCWRYKSEQIFFGNQIKNKSNLILAVGVDNVIKYKITSDNTNSEIFLSFLKELNIILKEKAYKKYILIMDNLKSHKKDNVINFFIETKTNVIFISPYCSIFNAVELCFRVIKRKTYSKLYSSLEEQNTNIAKILENEDLKVTLLKNYVETIQQYVSFYDTNKNNNLNNININNLE